MLSNVIRDLCDYEEEDSPIEVARLFDLIERGENYTSVVVPMIGDSKGTGDAALEMAAKYLSLREFTPLFDSLKNHFKPPYIIEYAMKNPAWREICDVIIGYWDKLHISDTGDEVKNAYISSHRDRFSEHCLRFLPDEKRQLAEEIHKLRNAIEVLTEQIAELTEENKRLRDSASNA